MKKPITFITSLLILLASCQTGEISLTPLDDVTVGSYFNNDPKNGHAWIIECDRQFETYIDVD